MKIQDIDNYIKNLIDPNSMKDSSQNGIQVENEKEIKKIAIAVDASLATINMAKENGADLLIVHHGLFWGYSLPIINEHYRRVKALIENDIGLIGYHLPLDASIDVGNNASIMRQIGIKEFVSFGNYHGVYIGYSGTFDKSLDIETIAKSLKVDLNERYIRYLSFGKKNIKSVAVVSGGGSSCLVEAIEKNIDLFITGEVPHYNYHTVLEGKINLLAAGHYYTETFGVKALAENIKKEFGIDYVFCDHPTNF